MERNKNGQLTKGTILNPKGRPKGTPNKATAELKELIKTFVENEIDEVENLLVELTPKERLDILCKLLPYVLPKQSEVKTDEQNEIIINFCEPEKVDLSKLDTETLRKLKDTQN